jgi:hypothetical protein
MVGQRQHASLENDAETNQAAWEAAKGAAWGGSKVSCTFPQTFCECLDIFDAFYHFLVKSFLPSTAWRILKSRSSRLRHAKLFTRREFGFDARSSRSKNMIPKIHLFHAFEDHTDMR